MSMSWQTDSQPLLGLQEKPFPLFPPLPFPFLVLGQSAPTRAEDCVCTQDLVWLGAAMNVWSQKSHFVCGVVL